MMGGSNGYGSMMMLRGNRSRSDKLLGVVVASSSSSSSSSSPTGHDIELNEDEIWGEAMTWSDGRSSPSRVSIEAVDSSSYGYGCSSSSSPSSSSSQGLSIPSDGRSDGSGAGASRRHLTRQQSAPMNVPNWSKILGNGGGGGSSSSAFDGGGGDDVDDVGDDARIPPHELVARGSGRSRALAFSVCEGLKGRELCRVRNAVLKQTGFL